MTRHSFLPDGSFRDISETLCRPVFTKTLKGLSPLLLSGCILSSTPHGYHASLDTSSPKLLVLGGYAAIPGLASADDVTKPNQNKYLTDKADLQKAMNICASDLTSCDPRVKAFSAMVEEARTMPDALSQLEFVNAWLNTLNYDEAETASNITDLDHHTLRETLDLNKGVCDEIARLKMMALENLGYKNVYWLAESEYINNQRQRNGHAVVVVSVDNKVWILNLGLPVMGLTDIPLKTVKLLMVENSRIETPSAQFNVSGQSIYADLPGNQDKIFLPVVAFNSKAIVHFNSHDPNKDRSNIPYETSHAAPLSAESTIDNLTKYNGYQSIISAFSLSFKIDYPIVPVAPHTPHSAPLRYSEYLKYFIQS